MEHTYPEYLERWEKDRAEKISTIERAIGMYKDKLLEILTLELLELNGDKE